MYFATKKNPNDILGYPQEQPHMHAEDQDQTFGDNPPCAELLPLLPVACAKGCFWDPVQSLPRTANRAWAAVA